MTFDPLLINSLHYSVNLRRTAKNLAPGKFQKFRNIAVGFPLEIVYLEYRVSKIPMPVSTSDIAILIRTLRQRLGLSQRKLGEKFGVVFQTVNNWENGRTKPTRMAMMLIQQQLEEMGEEGTDLLEKYFGE
ncbi:MAG: helix-turn-helix transcriptional regulator [Lyngbya sp.]|nr:helix-turn-helix transcriptional regulator [Lyngbya sp.]